MKKYFQPSKTGESESKLAIILAVLAIIFVLIPHLAFTILYIVLAVFAIILGAVGLSQAKKANISTSIAKIGMWMGIGLIFIPLIIYFSIFFAAKSDYLRNKMSQDKVEAIREDMKRHRDSVMKTEKIIQDTTQVQNK
ncbi:phage holin family protein [Flavobacterium sp.]|uniref:phage holin family protein n=1 Tax=Flavobacterium sp. TaxID=239 RepID=UPI0031D1FC82